MNLTQKIRIAKCKKDNEGQYKTFYKVYDACGTFLYYQVGANGTISEFLEDFIDLGYKFYNYQFELVKMVDGAIV